MNKLLRFFGSLVPMLVALATSATTSSCHVELPNGRFLCQDDSDCPASQVCLALLAEAQKRCYDRGVAPSLRDAGGSFPVRPDAGMGMDMDARVGTSQLFDASEADSSSDASADSGMRDASPDTGLLDANHDSGRLDAGEDAQAACDAGGKCELLALGRTCGAGAACASGSCVDQRCCEKTDCGVCAACDEAGRCQPVRNQDDADSCTGSESCNAEARCSKRLTTSCVAASECGSGHCVDGVCCKSNACGTCEVCSPVAGTCQPVRGAADPDSCGSGTICDGAGLCRSALGALCATGAECASGHCVDGVCCLSSGCGVCEACAPGSGQCTTLAAQDDADSCSDTMTCDPSGQCKLRSGAACRNATQCLTGHCTDGVCCHASACDPCLSCAPSGECDQRIVGRDDPGSCTGDNTCSADAQCRKRDGVACAGSRECASGQCVDGVCCGDPGCGTCQACALGSGRCQSVVNQPDLDSCSGDNICSASGQCRRRAGARCTQATECVTGNCVDNFCCASSSCATCAECTGAGGTCQALGSGVDDDSCNGDQACSEGTCRAINGQACRDGSQCVSQRCVDGVCCNETCRGTCSSCNQAGSVGSCSPVLSGPDADSCGAAPNVCSSQRACKRLDQQQLDEGANLAVGGTSEQKLAQVIIPSISGTLAELRIWIGCAVDARLSVELQGIASDGLPDGVAFASTTVEGDFPRPHAFTFSPAVTLTAGNAFAVVLSATNNTCGCSASGAEVYPGNYYFDSRPNAPGWVRWANDLTFETIMD